MDMQSMRANMQRCKNAGSVFYHKGRRVASYAPDSMPIERRALIEAEEILQKSGAGAMFTVYQSLSARFGSLIVLLPVSQTITDPLIAQALQQAQLVVAGADKIHCLSWYFGISAKTAKQHVAEMFNSDAEGTIRDVREMLTYALAVWQTARAEMQAYQSSSLHQENLKNWDGIKKHLNFPSAADREIENQKRNIPNGGADLLTVEDERLYNYITSAFARQIADSQGAYNEHQKWKRELLMLSGEDSADSGGECNITIGGEKL